MQRTQPSKPYRTVKRRRLPKWVIAALLGIALALCFAAVWSDWLLPTGDAPKASVSPHSGAQQTPAVTPLPASATMSSTTPIITHVPSPTPTPLLEAVACAPEDTGEDVKTLQTMLLDLGFDPGAADGVYKAQAKAAVQGFQLYAGLNVTGIADEKTAQAITKRWQAAQQPLTEGEQPLAGCVIGLDAGHQKTPNNGQESIAPGSEKTKDKVSRGTEGQYTGVPEYVVNLQVALKLKRVLAALGARVVMTRESHGVDIPNSQRAKMMNQAGVDCWLRIHANYSTNHKDYGMFILVPPGGGLNTDDPNAVARSAELAQALLQSTLQTTGAKSFRGLDVRSDQTGFGWSKVPVCNIEMGYMSNKAEDKLLVTEVYQQKIVDGLAQGFIEYYKASPQ